MVNETLQYHAVGLMSGTSLDGLDICYVRFTHNGQWEYTIQAAETVPYPVHIQTGLEQVHTKPAFEFIMFHKEYGTYIGETVKRFVGKNKCTPDFIASHGHTIFHQPEKKLTFQIGDGAAIAAVAGLPVICDFRNLDVMLGGQGAPLVPVGDELLFGNYTCCLNIGGFANISFNRNGKRIAYDICPANIVLNQYIRPTGKLYDDKGQMAASGNIHAELLDRLNSLRFYTQPAPKSLGREWVEKEFLPVVGLYNLSLPDILATLCEHAAMQIARNFISGNMLITGGGAYNDYLVSRIQAHVQGRQVIIPDSNTIDYKEALIFAFLGVLYSVRQVNCLQSVTGAQYNNIGGALYNPKPEKFGAF